jgi:hypothetical protein
VWAAQRSRRAAVKTCCSALHPLRGREGVMRGVHSALHPLQGSAAERCGGRGRGRRAPAALPDDAALDARAVANAAPRAHHAGGAHGGLMAQAAAAGHEVVVLAGREAHQVGGNVHARHLQRPWTGRWEGRGGRWQLGAAWVVFVAAPPFFWPCASRNPMQAGGEAVSRGPAGGRQGTYLSVHLPVCLHGVDPGAEVARPDLQAKAATEAARRGSEVGCSGMWAQPGSLGWGTRVPEPPPLSTAQLLSPSP